MVGKTAKYYHTHPQARKRKEKYDKDYNKQPERRKKRAELVQINRDHDKKYGKASRSGKDASHTSSGIVYKKAAVNRGSKSDQPGDRRARGTGRKRK